MIYTQFRKRFFDLLCRNSSPDFIEYLRAYECLALPPQESFEVSCELINGIRKDSMRVAIMCLYRQDVLRWLSACRFKIPLTQELLFENTTDDCFGIGLADYPSGSGACRIKIYNSYGQSQSQARKYAHIQHLFSLLEIKDVEFRQDWKRFGRVDVSGIDWDPQGKAAIKVYFGPFHSDQLFGAFREALLKEDLICYNILKENGLLSEAFLICAKYSRDGRSLRIDMHLRTKKITPFLKMFDPKREVSKFLLDFYRIFPGLSLQVIGMQRVPVEKVQYYFLVGKNLGRKTP